MSGIKYLSKGNLALLRCLALLRDDRGLLTLMYLQLEEIILCKKSNLLSRLSVWRILTQLLLTKMLRFKDRTSTVISWYLSWFRIVPHWISYSCIKCLICLILDYQNLFRLSLIIGGMCDVSECLITFIIIMILCTIHSIIMSDTIVSVYSCLYNCLYVSHLSMLRTTSMLDEAMKPPVLAIISTLQAKLPAYHCKITRRFTRNLAKKLLV